VTGMTRTGRPIRDPGDGRARTPPIFLNAQEIVTRDEQRYPEYLGDRYLLNPNNAKPARDHRRDYDESSRSSFVRTKRQDQLREETPEKVQTWACAQGTVFGDLRRRLKSDEAAGEKLSTSWLLCASHKIKPRPSLIRKPAHPRLVGAGDRALVTWRKSAATNASKDRQAGCSSIACDMTTSLHTTWRPTAEMVIQDRANMGFPI